MKKIIGVVILILGFGSLGLLAQEISGQGWTAPEPGQRTSGTAAFIVKGNFSEPAGAPLRDIVSRPVPTKNIKGPMPPPFPILMPKAVVYPRKAIRNGWEGQTVVAAEILPSGQVGRMGLAKSSGHGILDQAAQDAIKTWKFSDETGKTDAPQYVNIPVLFKLKDHGEE